MWKSSCLCQVFNYHNYISCINYLLAIIYRIGYRERENIRNFNLHFITSTLLKCNRYVCTVGARVRSEILPEGMVVGIRTLSTMINNIILCRWDKLMTKWVTWLIEILYISSLAVIQWKQNACLFENNNKMIYQSYVIWI